MNRENISRLILDAGNGDEEWAIIAKQLHKHFPDELEAFAALVASAEREACADIADKLPRTYRETKEAHERATLEPFHPSRFGFDFAEMRQAEVITHAIRARGQA